MNQLPLLGVESLAKRKRRNYSQTKNDPTKGHFFLTCPAWEFRMFWDFQSAVGCSMYSPYLSRFVLPLPFLDELEFFLGQKVNRLFHLLIDVLDFQKGKNQGSFFTIGDLFVDRF